MQLGNIRQPRSIAYHQAPAEVALNLAVGDFERNGDVYGHWGGMGVSSEENESE